MLLLFFSLSSAAWLHMAAAAQICDYTKGRWQGDDWISPNCPLPSHREAGAFFQEYLRSERMCFVGDSLTVQQWGDLAPLLGRNATSRSRMHECDFLVKTSTGSSGCGKSRYPLRVDLRAAPIFPYVIRNERCSTVIIGGGAHFFKVENGQNRQVLFEGSKSACPQSRCDKFSAFEAALRTVRHTLEQENFTGNVIWTTISPSHFSTGNWTNGTCEASLRYANATDTVPTLPKKQTKELNQGPAASRDADTFLFNKYGHQAWQGTTLKFSSLNITELSSLRPDAHKGLLQRGNTMLWDCLHWNTKSGVVRTWSRALALTLKRMTEPLSRG